MPYFIQNYHVYGDMLDREGEEITYMVMTYAGPFDTREEYRAWIHLNKMADDDVSVIELDI